MLIDPELVLILIVRILSEILLPVIVPCVEFLSLAGIKSLSENGVVSLPLDVLDVKL